MATLLLDCGADANLASTHNGWTAILEAALESYPMVELLDVKS